MDGNFLTNENTKMKKQAVQFITLLLMLGLFSCKKDNGNLWYPNYKYTTVYFPWQYPVRTLILGDYELADNTGDNNLQFVISADIGGLLTNNSDWTVGYRTDDSLANNLATNPNLWDGKLVASSDTLKVLPESYYTLSDHGKSTILIPNGSFNGGVTVQLNQNFLNDSMAWRTHYVLPLMITSTTGDSILSGASLVPAPDPRISANWSILPRNFTVFGIKFINPFHGNFFHRGQSVIDSSGTITQTINYDQPYLTSDEIWSLQTTGRNRVTVQGLLRSSPVSPGNFRMDLTFSDSAFYNNGNCTISTSNGSLFPVTGTGKFVREGDEWGGIKRNTIYLNYKVIDGTNTSSITDTLVYRDKGVSFQQYTPVIIQ